MSEDISIHDTESTDDLLQLVIFQLGGEEFGVEIMQVQEIIRMLGITRIPQSPEYVEGVIKKIEGILSNFFFPHLIKRL